jgi:capsular exopolysaccharide synthesis family protein
MQERLTPQLWTPPHDSAAIGIFEPEGNGSQESVLKQIVALVALLRRNLWIVALTTAAALAVLFLKLHNEAPSYRAAAVIRYQDKAHALSGGLGMPGEKYGPFTDPVLTQIQVLQSRGVAREVVDREGLRLQVIEGARATAVLRDVSVDSTAPSGTLRLTFGEREYQLRNGTRAAKAQYGAPTRLDGVQLTATGRPEVESAELEIMPTDRAVEAFQANLRGRPRERTDIIDVTYQASNPAAAQRIANTTVLTFQAHNARTTKQESARRRQFIEGQLRKAEMMLAEAQAAHNRFRSREKVYSSQARFQAQQVSLLELETRRSELGAERDTYAALLQSLQASSPSSPAGDRLDALVSAPGIAANPVVAQLYGQLARLQAARDSMTSGRWAVSVQNPDVRSLDTLIASTQSKMVAAVRGQIAAADVRLSALDELKTRSTAAMATLPRTEAEESGLLAQVETLRGEAARLREQLQKAQIDEAAEAGQIDVVDLATLPRLPIGAGRLPKLVLTLLIGLALGTVLSYLRENYMDAIRRREDLERVVARPVLAVVPSMAPNRATARLLPWMQPGQGSAESHHPREIAVLVNQRSQSAEAFRTLRTNILFSGAVQSLKQIVVTSAAPSEGKSVVAANLAVAFAQQGHRVLLVDCDLRRPRVHQVFGHTQMPGLTNLLAGAVQPTDAIHATEVDGLSILPAGTTPHNPSELLGSPRMKVLVDKLSNSYDVVIMDTPPVLVAADAAILGRHADGALLVARAGATRTAALREGVQQLSAVGANIIGTVLNDPDGEVARRTTYYGEYYQQYHATAGAGD